MGSGQCVYGLQKAHFGLIHFTPERAKRNILPGDFPEKQSIPITRFKFEYPHYNSYMDEDEYIVGEVGGTRENNLSFKGLRGNVHVSVTDYGYVKTDYQTYSNNPKDHVYHQIQRKLSISIYTDKDRYDSEITDDEMLGSWGFYLSPDTKVLSVAYGDYNADGLTDVAVRLSDGAAFVFPQKREPVVECGNTFNGFDIPGFSEYLERYQLLSALSLFPTF